MNFHNINPNTLLKSILVERWGWRVTILIVSLCAGVSGIMAPLSQKYFIDGLLAGQPAAIWVWSTFIFSSLAISLSQLSIWLSSRESLVTQKSLAESAYRKILEGPGGLIGRRPAGEGVSLYAVDVPGAAALLDQVLVMAGSMMFPLLLAPLALNHLFHVPLHVSYFTLVTITLINIFLARRQSRFFNSFKQLAAERTGFVNEWVLNIRTLRILGWTRFMESHIFKVRERETENRIAMVTNGQFMNSVASSMTYILNILAILYIVNLHQSSNSNPTAGELFSLLWILGVFLARPLRQFPWVLVISLDAWTSIKRMQNALTLPIKQPQVLGFDSQSNHLKPEISLSIINLNLENQGQKLLKNISLEFKKNEMIGIVGEVGSGKTLLLQSLVGSTGATFDQFYVNGLSTEGPISDLVRSQIAYVPQEGFTMNATLKENVVFGYLTKAEDPSRQPSDILVSNSLKMAQFNPEQENLSGLDTEIGERGVNLSGGQRQRVSIARAHFSNRPIVILDDSLSAVDVDTENKLIQDLILKEWANRTRIISTQRMSILPHCHRIIFIENGEVKAQGTFDELYKSQSNFRDFIKKGEIKGDLLESPIIDIEMKGDEVPNE